MLEQVRFVLDILPNLLIGFPGQRPGGLAVTLALALVAIGVGFGLAVPVSLALSSTRRPARLPARLFVELFQGLPLVVLLLLVYQVLGNPRFGLGLSPFGAALVALSLYSGAYQAEILQAGLASVPRPVVEAARMVGSSRWHTFRTVQLRYGLRVMLPALTGQAISLFKDTSIVVVLGVADLMTTARVALGSNLTHAPNWVTVYLAVGALYFGVAFTISQLAQRWEWRRRSQDLVHSLATH